MATTYIEKNLLQNEKIIYASRPHWIIFSSAFWAIFAALIVWIFAPTSIDFFIFGPWRFKDFIVGALFIVGAYWILTAYIYYATSEYGVTNKRVVIKVGWIKRTSLELMLDKVEGVLVDQTIIGRFLNYGAIVIIGTGGTKDRFAYVNDPLTFRRNVQQQVDNFEERLRE